MSGRGNWRPSPPTISLIVAKWQPTQVEQVSPVESIGGYPWRVRLLKRDDGKYELFLKCEMSTEAELWEIEAKIDVNNSTVMYYSNSWTGNTHEQRISVYEMIANGTRLEVCIHPNHKRNNIDGLCRPDVNLLEPHDGILVIGEEKKKVYVHTEFLAELSNFFHELFKGPKNMKEISIADVEYEEFSNMIRMAYGFDGASLTDDNVERVLDLARKLDLEIVEDRAVNYLLSSASSLSIHRKVLIAEERNLDHFKDRLILQYTLVDLKDLSEEAVYWNRLSKETTRAIVSHVASEFSLV